MAPSETASWRRPLPDDRPATDLRVVRWAALLFLLVDSTDSVVGVLAPSSVVTRPAVLDVAQTVLGLATCACLLWWRWRWAAPATALLVVMMLLRHPVGIEISVLIVGAATVAAAVRPRQVPLSLLGWVAFAAVLGYSMHREDGVDRLPASLVAVLLAGLATLAGMVAGRLLREREAAHGALRLLQAENLRIRADERRTLAGELQSILTRDFSSMRAAVSEVPPSGEPGELRRTISEIGDRSRSTLASVRVALRTLRADLEPVTVTATRTTTAPHSPAWIGALGTPRFRRVLRLASLVAAGGAAAYAVWSSAEGGAVVVLDVVVAVASPVTVAVALGRPRAGLVSALVVLAVGLATPMPSLWLAVPTALLAFTAAQGGRWSWIAVAVAAQLAYMAAQLARHGSEAGPLVGVLEAVGISSLLLGLTLRHFESVHTSTAWELEQLHEQQSRIAAEERAEVARELHDVVGHQLSLVSLQALAAEREQDPVVLRGLLHRIHDALESGESEISGLVGALHSTTGPVTGAGVGPLLTPTVVASDLSRQLEGHDYLASFSIDPRVDALDPTTQSTVARILRESGTNVLRHAPSGAECTFAATIDGGTLTFLARSPLPATAPDQHLSGGYGLRGIRERVDLTGGTFFAGSRDGSWEVRVCIRAQTEARRHPPLELDRPDV